MSTMILAVGLLAGSLTGCANELTPPAQVAKPATIHLVDHGRHPSLILPDSDGAWIRYVHGEWRWYAKNETGAWRGIEALLWPTQAAIGRRRLEALPSRDGASPAIPEGFDRIRSFTVEREHVEALRARLDLHFIAAQRYYYQPRYNLVFAPYPRDYWLGHHSNRVMAQWLRALGIEVRGPALMSRWRLAPSGED